MINYDLCDKGWEFYDLFVYWQERHELDPKYHKEYQDAKSEFIKHKKKCGKSGILKDHNQV